MVEWWEVRRDRKRERDMWKLIINIKKKKLKKHGHERRPPRDVLPRIHIYIYTYCSPSEWRETIYTLC